QVRHCAFHLACLHLQLYRNHEGIAEGAALFYAHHARCYFEDMCNLFSNQWPMQNKVGAGPDGKLVFRAWSHARENHRAAIRTAVADAMDKLKRARQAHIDHYTIDPLPAEAFSGRDRIGRATNAAVDLAHG